MIPPPPPAYLTGTTGTARWSRASSVLLLPQIGLPAAVTLRVRAPEPTGSLEIWQNGRERLTVVPLTGAWQTISVDLQARVASGILKPSDVVLELRTTPTRLTDGREVGVLVDSVSYRTTALPSLPYPAQLLIAALLGIGGWLLVSRTTPAPAHAAGGGCGCGVCLSRRGSDCMHYCFCSSIVGNHSTPIRCAGYPSQCLPW